MFSSTLQKASNYTVCKVFQVCSVLFHPVGLEKVLRNRPFVHYSYCDSVLPLFSLWYAKQTTSIWRITTLKRNQIISFNLTQIIFMDGQCHKACRLMVLMVERTKDGKVWRYGSKGWLKDWIYNGWPWISLRATWCSQWVHTCSWKEDSHDEWLMSTQFLLEYLHCHCRYPETTKNSLAQNHSIQPANSNQSFLFDAAFTFLPIIPFDIKCHGSISDSLCQAVALSYISSFECVGLWRHLIWQLCCSSILFIVNVLTKSSFSIA